MPPGAQVYQRKDKHMHPFLFKIIGKTKFPSEPVCAHTPVAASFKELGSYPSVLGRALRKGELIHALSWDRAA